jgi:large subunit ribosomal protein L24
MAFHVRKDDVVEVVAGDHQGERGKVLKVIPKRNLVVVQGINMVFRHVRPSRKNPQGGRLQKEAPMQISNVMPIDEKTGKGTRVRFAVDRGADGKPQEKARVSVKGTRLSTVSRIRAAE